MEDGGGTKTSPLLPPKERGNIMDKEELTMKMIKDNIKKLVDNADIKVSDIPALCIALHCTPNEIMGIDNKDNH